MVSLIQSSEIEETMQFLNKVEVSKANLSLILNTADETHPSPYSKKKSVLARAAGDVIVPFLHKLNKFSLPGNR